MQTRTIINKIRWIRSQLSDELEKWMFPLQEPENINPIENIHNSSRFAEVVSRDAAAVDILRMFGLHFLTDREKMVQWLDGQLREARAAPRMTAMSGGWSKRCCQGLP